MSFVNGIILKGLNIVVPKYLRKEMLKKVHVGHLGIEICQRRAREVLLNQEVAEMVNNVLHATNTSHYNHQNL